MQRTILKYISGLTDAEKQSLWKVKKHKDLTSVRRNINFDIKYGVTRGVFRTSIM
jgi:hypothetical protein